MFPPHLAIPCHELDALPGLPHLLYFLLNCPSPCDLGATPLAFPFWRPMHSSFCNGSFLAGDVANPHSRPKIATFTWWGCLHAPTSPRAMLAGPLEVLVGTPMPDRSKVRGQTKSNLPALKVWGFCIGLTTLSCKKLLLRKQQRVTYKNHLCRNNKDD